MLGVSGQVVKVFAWWDDHYAEGRWAAEAYDAHGAMVAWDHCAGFPVDVRAFNKREHAVLHDALAAAFPGAKVEVESW
jgi:hypothetical protein